MLQAGIDEVGYGSAFGPLTLALVVIEDNIARELGAKDSKKLTPKKREKLYPLIKEKADYYNIVSLPASAINERGVIQCWKDIVKDLYTDFRTKYPDMKLHIDGSSHLSLPNTTYLHKGDDLIPAISCASIVAKVYRDTEVCKLQGELDNDYDINSNKGYLTAKHIAALKKYGSTSYHRTQYIRNHL